MKILFASILVLFLFSQPVFSQSCNCAVEFQFVKDKIEKNYAGYKDKVNPKNKAAYQKLTQQLLEKASSTSSAPACIYLINQWLDFFKDGHVEIGRNRLSRYKYVIDQGKLVKSVEKVYVSESELKELQGAKGIEGIYWSPDSTYKIAIVKNETDFRNYAGVVLESKNTAWKPGDVNLELKLQKDSLKGVEYDKYYTPVSVAMKVNEQKLGEWQREGTAKKKTEKILTDDVSCKQLSNQTFYIQIGTFNQRNAKNIDSLININREILDRTPNLILDLRNNGGGADFSYQPLTPYLYTNPIKEIGTNILSSEDNIAGWAALLTMNDIPQEQKTFIQEKIDLMTQHPGEFVQMGKDTEKVLDGIKLFPKKVVILVNKGCGSTTEQFLLEAIQSKKVTLMGENSAGVLDYANVRDVGFDCMPYALHYPTSRSRRVDIGQGIDNVGIKPGIKLTPDQNWVLAAQRFLEK